jgi:two-component system response regulator
MNFQPKNPIILVVEDNPDDEALTLRALQHNGVSNEVVVARDGAEALDYLHCRGAFADREPVLPQVVLLDLRLPKVDGLQVLREVRSHPATKCLPVVVLTSSDEEQDIVRSYDLGANSYVRKPVEFSEFTQSIRQLGLYWLLINTTAARRGS